MALKQQTVQVTKAFRHRGEDLGAGSVVVLDTPLAQELRSAKRCEFVENGTKPVVVPLKAKVKPPSYEDQQRAALELQQKQLAALAQLTATLADAVEKLAAASGKKGKE